MMYNYLPTFYFKVTIKDLEESLDFHEVSGIQSTVEVEIVKGGGDNDLQFKLPKTITHPNLVLRRAVTSVDKNAKANFLKWVMNATEKFQFVPKLVQVSLMKTVEKKEEAKSDPKDAETKETGKESVKATLSSESIKVWDFEDAYPLRIQYSDLKADANELLIETLELAYKKVHCSM